MSPDKVKVKVLRATFNRWSVRGVKIGMAIFAVIAAVILFTNSSLTIWQWMGLFAGSTFVGWLEQMVFGWSLDPSEPNNRS